MRFRVTLTFLQPVQPSASASAPSNDVPRVVEQVFGKIDRVIRYAATYRIDRADHITRQPRALSSKGCCNP